MIAAVITPTIVIGNRIGTTADGTRAASGVYWCRLDYAGWTETEKVLLVR